MDHGHIAVATEERGEVEETIEEGRVGVLVLKGGEDEKKGLKCIYMDEFSAMSWCNGGE